MKTCPDSTVWPRLLDGDLPEREAQPTRAHAESCPACAALLEESRLILRELAQPVVAPDEVSVRKLLQRVTEVERPSRYPKRAWVPIAVAATVLLSVVTWRSLERTETFTARGGSLEWRQRVSAEIRPVLNAAQPWGAHPTLTPDTALVVWYRNLETQKPLYLAAFLIDGAGEVHWVSPAWGAGVPAPRTSLLPKAETEALMPSSFIPSQPANGDGELVTLVSTQAVSVEEIEGAERARRAGKPADLPGVMWRQPVRIEAR